MLAETFDLSTLELPEEVQAVPAHAAVPFFYIAEREGKESMAGESSTKLHSADQVTWCSPAQKKLE